MSNETELMLAIFYFPISTYLYIFISENYKCFKKFKSISNEEKLYKLEKAFSNFIQKPFLVFIILLIGYWLADSFFNNLKLEILSYETLHLLFKIANIINISFLLVFLLFDFFLLEEK